MDEWSLGSWMSGSLGTWMSGGLDSWMSGGLDSWMSGGLDSCINSSKKTEVLDDMYWMKLMSGYNEINGLNG